MLDLIRNKIKTLKEDAVSDVKAKHVDELERLKTRQERELEQLKSRQVRQTDTAKSNVDAEKEREKQRKSVSSEETSVKQDKDVKDKKGTQPAKYYAGDMSKSTKDKRDAHFKAKKSGPAPGDHDAETKPSQHTIKFKKMFGEGSLEEDNGLQAKADKSGISKGILQKVYNRGLAAFKTGHRPGATAPQWAMARVNSFITKGSGTWGGADKDLAKQAGGKSESVEEDRDYKKEYENYQGKPEQIKRRAKRNEARRSLKDRKDIKGKDVHHKDNNPMNNDKSNLSIVSKNFNRKEPRLRELRNKGALPKC